MKSALSEIDIIRCLRKMTEEERKTFIDYSAGMVSAIEMTLTRNLCERVLDAEVERLIFKRKNNLDDRLWKS